MRRMRLWLSKLVPMRWSVSGLMSTADGNREERRSWWQWRGRVFAQKTVRLAQKPASHV